MSTNPMSPWPIRAEWNWPGQKPRITWMWIEADTHDEAIDIACGIAWRHGQPSSVREDI